MLVWSQPRPPKDPRHVVNSHPEWIARLKNGRPMTSLTGRQLRRLGVEGVFLSPALPGVRAWLGSIVKEIASRYAVDGVQLDYIRLPGVELGGESGAAAADEATAPRAPGAGRPPARARTPRTEAECAHVAAVVGEVRDSLAGVRSGPAADRGRDRGHGAAVRTNAQRWTAWLREGLIDRAFTMCYAPPLRTVVAQLLTYAGFPGLDGRVVPGIAVYNTPPATAAAKIRAARSLGFAQLAIYSYDAPRLEARLLVEPVQRPRRRGARARICAGRRAMTAPRAARRRAAASPPRASRRRRGTTCATSRSSPTSITARPRWWTRCCGRAACSARTRRWSSA
jgi:uncharacterized lipoprotein YddW (UPF0748 family)